MPRIVRIADLQPYVVAGYDLIRCTKCGDEKPADEFFADPRKRNGRYSWCKACCAQRTRDADKAKGAAHSTRWRRKYPEKALAASCRHKLKKYGLTHEDYDGMMQAQNGRCLICDRELDRKQHSITVACVDHCHETGRVRSLLCRRCNQSLGQFEDDPDLLRRAADYLEKHGR